MDPGVCGPRGKLTRTVFNIHGYNEFSPACLSEKGERMEVCEVYADEDRIANGNRH